MNLKYCRECVCYYNEYVNANHEDMHGLTEEEKNLYGKGYSAGVIYGKYCAIRDLEDEQSVSELYYPGLVR